MERGAKEPQPNEATQPCRGEGATQGAAGEAEPTPVLEQLPPYEQGAPLARTAPPTPPKDPAAAEAAATGIQGLTDTKVIQEPPASFPPSKCLRSVRNSGGSSSEA